MRDKLKKTVATVALASVLSLPSVAFAEGSQSPYLTGQKFLEREHQVASSTGAIAALTCAGLTLWAAPFTFGSAPMLAGFGCSTLATSIAQSVMRCSLDKATRVRSGLGSDCITIAFGIKWGGGKP